MSKFVLKYQAGIFGEFARLRPDPSIMKKAIDALSSWGMIPGPFAQLQEDGRHLDRMMMSSAEHSISVFFATNRIDVIKSPSGSDDDGMGEYSEFCSISKKIFLSLFDEFSLAGNRLTSVIDVLFEEMPVSKMNSFRDVVIPVEFNLNGDDSREWGVRKNNIVDMKIMELCEKFNSIVNVSRTQGNIGADGIIKGFDRIRLLWDFNSLPGNDEERFSSAHVEEFLDSVPRKYSELCELLGGIAR